MRERNLADHGPVGVGHRGIGAGEGGGCTPGVSGCGDGADEEVDEEGFCDLGAVELDVDEVLVAHGVGVWCRSVESAAGDASCRVVELIESGFGVCCELRRVHTPIIDLWVRVSEGSRGSGGL